MAACDLLFMYKFSYVLLYSLGGFEQENKIIATTY